MNLHGYLKEHLDDLVEIRTVEGLFYQGRLAAVDKSVIELQLLSEKGEDEGLLILPMARIGPVSIDTPNLNLIRFHQQEAIRIAREEREAISRPLDVPDKLPRLIDTPQHKRSF